jgi:hypothetical protein
LLAVCRLPLEDAEPHLALADLLSPLFKLTLLPLFKLTLQPLNFRLKL